MDFIQPILYIGITQSLFAGLLIATRKPFTTANRLITAWVFLFCTELIFALINRTVLAMYSFPFIAFTYGPILYLYVLHLTDPDRKFHPLNYLHFIPFIAFFAVSVVFREKPIFDDLSGFLVTDRFISLRIVYGICFFLSISTYSILSFIEIRRHQKRLKDIVSFAEAKMTLNWLKILSITFYIGYLIVFILGGIEIFSDLVPFDPYIIVFVFITFFSFVYSFYAIRQPVIFDGIFEEKIEEESDYSTTEKYARSGLRDEQATEYLQKILLIMDEEKPYIDSNLTIHDLSRKTGIPRHYITEILNEKHGRNFFTFINEYRVKEVIRRFNDPRYQHYTVLAIAFDSGFNSKSTFNSIFKSYTGKTPSQFRESIDMDPNKV